MGEVLVRWKAEYVYRLGIGISLALTEVSRCVLCHGIRHRLVSWTPQRIHGPLQQQSATERKREDVDTSSPSGHLLF